MTSRSSPYTSWIGLKASADSLSNSAATSTATRLFLVQPLKEYIFKKCID